MAEPQKQHLIDPEFCIRCYTCEETCPIEAITHNDDNVVVDASICNLCMDCISPCPTGSIDSWRVVAEPYSLEDQLGWMELPEQQQFADEDGGSDIGVEALDEDIAALLAQAHKGSGQVAAPSSASKPSINLRNLANPVEGKIQGNFRLTSPDADSDVRHIIINLGNTTFPVLEGQSVGIICPGTDENGKPHLPRLYSISSPRDGERPNVNNISLTIKREKLGVCSNYVCDLAKGDVVKLTGPFGASFLMPDDPQAKLLMICTGTGSAPFRAFTMRRQRVLPEQNGALKLFFGARTPDSLPYFGPLNKIPDDFLDTHFAFSRVEGQPKNYVQDELRLAAASIAEALKDPQTYIYICGMKAMEEGVDSALYDIAGKASLDWNTLKDEMRKSGRYHVETY
ncbi:MAG: benzoyl-CoA 2,3-epoxidase subunit BoxA [Hyphomicrobiales bacterium]|nr:benzoyl-CoA 2,3-epoxidase subunit BoxA [Hyphomicrobiales bacterium]